jgi:hypothetical protein
MDAVRHIENVAECDRASSPRAIDADMFIVALVYASRGECAKLRAIRANGTLSTLMITRSLAIAALRAPSAECIDDILSQPEARELVENKIRTSSAWAFTRLIRNVRIWGADEVFRVSHYFAYNRNIIDIYLHIVTAFANSRKTRESRLSMFELSREFAAEPALGSLNAISSTYDIIANVVYRHAAPSADIAYMIQEKRMNDGVVTNEDVSQHLAIVYYASHGDYARIRGYIAPRMAEHVLISAAKYGQTQLLREYLTDVAQDIDAHFTQFTICDALAGTRDSRTMRTLAIEISRFPAITLRDSVTRFALAIYNGLNIADAPDVDMIWNSREMLTDAQIDILCPQMLILRAPHCFARFYQHIAYSSVARTRLYWVRAMLTNNDNLWKFAHFTDRGIPQTIDSFDVNFNRALDAIEAHTPICSTFDSVRHLRDFITKNDVSIALSNRDDIFARISDIMQPITSYTRAKRMPHA